MSNINIQQALQGRPQAFVQAVSRLPELLQREVLAELSGPKYPDEDDIAYLNSWKVGNQPIRTKMTDLLKHPDNLFMIGKTAQPIREAINKKWGLNIPQGDVEDPNPMRHLETTKLSGDTAKPSVMVNGEIVWGCGRFFSALLRGDQTMMVWDVRR